MTVVYDFAEFRVDPRQRLLLLRDGGKPLPLNSRAFDTLLFFLENHGKLLDKSTLMSAIWPNVVVEENNLNQHISALRRVLGETRDDHRFIVTEPGRGYRFVAQVTTATSADNPPLSTPAPHSHRVRPGWMIGAIAAAVIAGVGIWWFRPGAHTTRVASEAVIAPVITRTPGAAVRGRGMLRLAVMPFQNLSPDPNNAFFADGLHEEILSTLGERLRLIQVISRTTMISDRLKGQPIATVASILGATHVIEGSVRREGSTVRLSLELIDAGSDRQIWSRTYDRTLTSALTLQSEVANEVAPLLSVQLATAAQGPGPPTADAQAYDLYLKAVIALRDLIGSSPLSDFKHVQDLLDAAIARDPQFALAYTQRARNATLLFIGGQDTSERLLQRIRDDLATALSLSPQLPEALAAEGFFFYGLGDNERALASVDAAQAAGLADPVFLIAKTRILMRMGRVEEAVRLNEHMLEIDPANPLLIEFAVNNSIILRKPAEALHMADLAADQFPDLHKILRFTTLFAYTGSTKEMRAANDGWSANRTLAQLAARPPAVRYISEQLRLEHRYPELMQLLRLVPATPVPYGELSSDYELYDVGEIGDVPAGIQFRGWTALLLGDRAAAATEGHALLRYLGTRKVTPRTEFFQRRLEAEGALFSGHLQQAIAAANASLALVPRSRNAAAWVGVAMMTARIDAWAGATSQADDLLKQLASATPGLPPALITRDPLYAVPLAHDAQYQLLSRSLEEQMTALNLH